MRGGIFAVFTPSPGDEHRERSFGGRGYHEPLAAPVAHAEAAADATAAAGRLAALERGRRARARAHDRRPRRRSRRLDAAGRGPPPRGRRGDRPRPRGARPLARRRPALARPGLEPGQRVRPRRAVRRSLLARHRPRPERARRRAGRSLRRARRPRRPQPPERGRASGTSPGSNRGRWSPATPASHAICRASRNLTDEQLEAIGASGGLVGIVFATPFLRPDFGDEPDTPLALIVEHARYVADLIGAEHVALGSDFDGATIPAALGDVAGLPRLVAGSHEAGFDGAELDAVCWDNWRRVLAAWWR